MEVIVSLSKVLPAEHFREVFGTDNLILQALEVMGYGIAGVFFILAVFYLLISGMKRIWPADVED